MKKSLLFLLLSVWYAQAQTPKCPPDYNSQSKPALKVAMGYGKPQNLLGGKQCEASVVPPAVVNGVNVTDSFTGDVTFYGPAFESCQPPISTPPDSRHLGSNGAFIYTMSFDQPVNNVVFVINGAGYEVDETFTITTNGGIPTIAVSASCFTTVVGNTIYSGGGSTPTNSHNGGGGIFTISAPASFTSFTIEGPGGIAGSLVAICANSIVPPICNVNIAPALTETTITNICPLNTVDLTSITATNWPIFENVILTWHTSLPITPTNQLTTAQAAQAPAGQTYYAAFYDQTNDCYGNATPVVASLLPLITPTFVQVGPYCAGDNIPPLPTVSTNGFGGIWFPAINPNATGTYAFSPTGTLCASPTTMTIVVNQPVMPIFNQVNPICVGDEPQELPTVSINNISGSWSPPINNTETTNYTFTPDGGECATETNMRITVLPVPDAEITSRCVGLNYVLTASSETPNVRYEWFNADGRSIGTTASIVITSAGTYSVFLKTDDCGITKTIDVASIYCDIPKGISPDGDGKNDFFDLSNFDVDHLKIFNRYGMVVYERDDYEKEWDGNSDNGNELPDATYYYYIRFQNGETKTGWVYLNRKH
ncbi:gliding motility-associated C-terminal domain-containing protein [Flavobacterium sp.]|uniref:gliding motility-associated C-terminal domain-containing protein n=1 Tax=Flavobacterium sp. TaxID=239 RepID=UPI0039E49BBA